MQKMLDTVLTSDFIQHSQQLAEKNRNKSLCTIIDYGGRRVEGHDSYFSLVQNIVGIEYLGVDISAGPGVDVVMTDPYCCPLPDQAADIIVTGQMFEHCEFFWLTVKDMARLLRPGGYILAITPSGGAVHRYPVDCWRFYPDAYAALAKWANLELVDAWHDPRPKWYDQVGILRKPQ